MNPADEALFFENPAVYRPLPGDFGILYLLRRDINQCLEHKSFGPGRWPSWVASIC